MTDSQQPRYIIETLQLKDATTQNIHIYNSGIGSFKQTEGWVPVNSRLIRDELPKADIKALEGAGLVEINHDFKPGEYPKSYRLTPGRSSQRRGTGRH